MAGRGDVIELVEEHVCAFNAGEVGRVLAGLAADVVWQTGSDEFVGLDEVERLLHGEAGLFPVLETKRVLVDGQRRAEKSARRGSSDRGPVLAERS
ncbi:MAG: nuclear transport factor 2 family protein [Solirubrobacterales bacterium]|nr:nuclear transport factor 2 family protein [Solirubrobacterales bacterium]MBV9681578.1 nuclear transport factor 2 family protein [Solirubrobacterales bacterium]MBV9807943.1 nuclear transport factor 2 family protein [Solirubrobacterales bacterium]